MTDEKRQQVQHRNAQPAAVAQTAVVVVLRPVVQVGRPVPAVDVVVIAVAVVPSVSQKSSSRKFSSLLASRV